MHYAELGDFKKEKTAIPLIPLEGVVYASITHECTYGNVGDKGKVCIIHVTVHLCDCMPYAKHAVPLM